MTAKKVVLRVILALVAAALVAAIGIVAFNRFYTDFDDLSDTDRQILSEIDVFFKANSEQAVFEGYDLENKMILAIGNGLKSAYLVNPSGEINSVFAAKINMPQDSALTVYRLSFLAPQTLAMRLEAGNFNTIGKVYKAFGNEVYFMKYNRSESLEAVNSSKHFINLLTHEAFHYYMQNQWSDGSRFDGELSEEDIDLLAEEYDALAGIQEELLRDEPRTETLLRHAQEYASAMRRRLEANPEYVRAELSMETDEGTAKYVGIRASRIVGYDYGVMYFDNVKNVSFAEVVPMFRSGGIDESFLSDRMPYETGALLCELLDALGAQGWQQKLNAQTPENTTTLYALVEEYLAESAAQ